MAINIFPATISIPSPQEIRTLIQLHQDGELDKAYTQAKSLSRNFPRHPLAWATIGSILRARGDNKRALPYLRKVVDLRPGEANDHFNLANTLRDLDRQGEAAGHYYRALKINPDLPHGFFHLGNAQHDIGQLFSAERSYRKALDRSPGHIETLGNLAHVLQDGGRLDEAQHCYDQALKIDPCNATLYCNYADLQLELGQIVLAISSARKAIELQPTMGAAYARLANILESQGALRGAIQAYLKAVRLDPENTDNYSSLHFAESYLPKANPKRILGISRRFGKITSKKTEGFSHEWRGAYAPSRLRIGFISGDLRDHPVGHFLEGVVRHLNPLRTELVGLSTQRFEDDVSRKIRASFEEWHCLAGMPDIAAARMIRELGLHVVLDLAGHTAGNRLPLFAYRLAPVQATWLGYFATTGVREMDYLIADPLSLPQEFDSHFTESIWRLPETRLCFTPPEEDISVGALPAKLNGFVTFGSVNNLLKINDQVIALWSRILKRVQGSRLLLQAKQLGCTQHANALIGQFTRNGIAPDRLMIEPPAKRGVYLSTYHRVDLCLDPFPYPGGTTTAESLWMGVPIVTMKGRHFLGRQGYGLLSNAGLHEWVAIDETDYEARAVRLAENIDALAKLRANLRNRVLASPVFDAPRFARHLEGAFWNMWERKKNDKVAW